MINVSEMKKYYSEEDLNVLKNLDEKQVDDIAHIAKQLPWSIETVAGLYVRMGCSALATMQHLSETYGFIFLV